MFLLEGFFLILIIIMLLPYYILTSLLLYSYNKKAYGKGTALAWIPILRIYLFGKYAFSDVVGVILFFAVIFFNLRFELNLGTEIIKYPPYDIPYASLITFLFVIVCIIIIIINYFKLKKGEIPNSLKNERLKKEQSNNIKQEENVVNNTETTQNENNNINNNIITNEEKKSEIDLTELKSNEVYDASNAALEAKLHKEENIAQSSVQVEKVNCPNCGVAINKEVKVCPFCGKENNT